MGSLLQSKEHQISRPYALHPLIQRPKLFDTPLAWCYNPKAQADYSWAEYCLKVRKSLFPLNCIETPITLLSRVETLHLYALS